MTDHDQLLFPHSERVEYGHNPLKQVVCQLRFPTYLPIGEHRPTAFQERLYADFPKLEERAVQRVELPPLEALSLMGPGAFQGLATTREYTFANSDERWRVGLTDSFVALSTTEYRRWDAFKSKLTAVLAALTSAYPIPFFTRVGLRYVDVIDRSALGLRRKSWAKLLARHILGELSNGLVERAALSARRELVLELPAGGLVRVVHGFQGAGRGAARTAPYVLDADFYAEGSFGAEEALASCDRFREEAGNAFRWWTTSTLREALEAVPVQQEGR